MLIEGHEFTKEDLEKGDRVSAAVLAVLMIEYPDQTKALCYGLGGIVSGLMNRGAQEDAVIAIVRKVFYIIHKYDDEATRLLNGPKLEVLKGGAGEVEG